MALFWAPRFSTLPRHAFRLAPGEEKIFHDTISFIRAGEAALALAARLIAEPPADALHALDDAKLAAPILPSTILCAGSNYRDAQR